MTAWPSHFNQQNEPLEFRVPEAALSRLQLRLGRAARAGEVWDQALLHGAPPAALEELLDYWCSDHDFRASVARLNRLPLFGTSEDAAPLVFVHRPSKRPDAIPLLLLHGSVGSPLELAALLEPLGDPAIHGGRPSDAFHVVCPALPGFGITPAVDASLVHLTEACAELMASLGYRRYVAHGCEVGAVIARELLVSDAQHAAGALLGDCPAFPAVDPCELALLSGAEKCQLALLGELHERSLHTEHDNPVALLAGALAQLDDALSPRARDDLLFGLSLRLLADNSALVASLNRARFRDSPRSARPLGVCSFPLDHPTLRRFAERQQRVVSFREAASGGCLPGLEQPQLLVEQLVDFCTRFR